MKKMGQGVGLGWGLEGGHLTLVHIGGHVAWQSMQKAAWKQVMHVQSADD